MLQSMGSQRVRQNWGLNSNKHLNQSTLRKYMALLNVGGPQLIIWKPQGKNWPPSKKREFCRWTGFSLKLQHQLHLGSSRASWSPFFSLWFARPWSYLRKTGPGRMGLKEVADFKETMVKRETFKCVTTNSHCSYTMWPRTGLFTSLSFF